jgi:hypothetical protein
LSVRGLLARIVIVTTIAAIEIIAHSHTNQFPWRV